MMSEMDLTKDKRERIMRYVLLALTFAALLISGIACSTPILKLIPLFNSLFIMMLQAKANRYAYILGIRPEMHIGICGEHGGDPTSVEFCHKIGLSYVSCSPFRVPIARLAAAQVALK